MSTNTSTTVETEPAARTKKCSHVGAPAIFALEQVCLQINEAFRGASFGHCCLVGSALERADWRDVDVRFIMPDEEFAALFPDATVRDDAALWEHDPRWVLMTVSIAERMSKVTGLPIDFQFQPAGFANKHHGGKTRHAIGMRFKKE